MIIRYFFTRIIYFFLTLYTAFTITYILIRLMPVDAVENIIAQMTAQGQVYDPAALNELRQQLYEIFGFTGSPIEQYFRYLLSIFTLNFGPSILAFPTPSIELIWRQLPWTIGLLTVSVVISWVAGNLIGIIASVREGSRISKILQAVALTIYPIPYYIMALILIFFFAYLIPLFPLTGSTAIFEEINLDTVINIVKGATLPALSIIIVSMLGWWFLSSRILTLNTLSEDFIEYAMIRGLPWRHIFRRYLMKNILLPQVTALGLALGSIFSGAILTEVVFAYPGLGQLLYRAISNGDISTALGIVTLSIYAVALATLILDLIYPLIDPRVRYK